VVKQYQKEAMCPDHVPVIIKASKKGKGGYGTAYAVSCSGSEDGFIIKWVRNEDNQRPEVYHKIMDDQIELQNLAARFHLSLPVYYKVKCPITGEEGFLMPMAKHTAMSVFDTLLKSYVSQPAFLTQARGVLESRLQFVYHAFRRYVDEKEWKEMIRNGMDLVQQINSTKVVDWSALKRELRIMVLEFLIGVDLPFDVDAVVDAILDTEMIVPITDVTIQQKIRSLREKLEHKLAQLNEVGIVHTDAHLDNFMWWKNDWYLIDFGLAAYVEDSPEFLELETEAIHDQLQAAVRIK